MASNRYYKSEGVRQEEVSYFDLEVWSKVAESCEKHLKKGRGVRVVGRLKQDRWTDDQGSLHNRGNVWEHVEFEPEHRSGSRIPGQADEAEAIETQEMMDTHREEPEGEGLY